MNYLLYLIIHFTLEKFKHPTSDKQIKLANEAIFYCNFNKKFIIISLQNQQALLIELKLKFSEIFLSVISISFLNMYFSEEILKNQGTSDKFLS